MSWIRIWGSDFMFYRVKTLKLIVLLLVMIMVAYPIYAFEPQEEVLDLELNESYIVLEYGYEAPLDMRGFQFVAQRAEGDCPDLVWSLSDTKYLTVDENGYVSVCNGSGPIEGDVVITLSCSTGNGCIQEQAQIMLLAPTALGGPPAIPKSVEAKPSMYNYSDMTMDYILPMNKLNTIKFIRNRSNTPPAVDPLPENSPDFFDDSFLWF